MIINGRYDSEAPAWICKGGSRVDKVYMTPEFTGERVTGGADDLLAGRSMCIDAKFSIEELIRDADGNGEAKQVSSGRSARDIHASILEP